MTKKVFKAAILELMEEYAINKWKEQHAKLDKRKTIYKRMNASIPDIIDGYIDDYTDYLAMYESEKHE